jgi:hypothetical protein
MEFHEISMEFHQPQFHKIPWNSTEFHGKFHGIPWTFPWKKYREKINQMFMKKFHGIPLNSIEFCMRKIS